MDENNVSPPMETLFRAQAALMRRLSVPTLSVQAGQLYDLELAKDDEDVMKWVERSGDKLIMEGSEVKDWTPWKHWSTKSGNKLVSFNDLGSPSHMAEIRAEAIDCLHFTLELLIILGITHETVVEEYLRKHQVNHERQDSGAY